MTEAEIDLIVKALVLKVDESNRADGATEKGVIKYREQSLKGAFRRIGVPKKEAEQLAHKIVQRP